MNLTFVFTGIFFLFSVLAAFFYFMRRRKKVSVSKADFSFPYKYLNVRERAILLNKEIEISGFAYDYLRDIFYSLMDPWQRKFGYCRLYDESAPPLSMIIDCEPIYFEYDNRYWLIEFWKGQYGMTTGAEIGIYATAEKKISIPDVFTGTLYDSVKDEELLPMAFTLRKNGNVLFKRKDKHWWLTGFKLGEYSKPEELTMEIKLKFPTTGMRDAFLNGLKSTGYTEEYYHTFRNSVFIVYQKPFSEQPYTRTSFTEYWMQKNNKRNCNAYTTLTKTYQTTIDKLTYLSENYPKLYEKALHIGKDRRLFQDLKIYGNQKPPE